MVRLALLVAMCWCSIHSAWAELAIPEPLQPWRDWVLHDHPQVGCPFIYNQAERTCVWPSRLKLDLQQTGGQFELQVDVFADQWVALPGGDGQWPESVTLGGGDLAPAIVRREGKPRVFLPAGQHRLKGVWTWSQLPRELSVPEQFGILQLTLKGKAVRQPSFSGAGALWLTTEQNIAKEAERDSLSVKVFRKVSDSNPLVMETLVQLNVSGKEREVQMGPALLQGFVPRELRSELPARIEPDGSLRVQVKPGRWDIHVVAHLSQFTTELSYPVYGELWPPQEIWAFAAEPALRTVQIEGVPAVDPSQTQLPEMWRHLPAFLMTPSDTFVMNVLHRGDPNPAANQLTLEKDLWLDFDGEGFTVKDQISGTMHQNWRLEVSDAYHLGRVELDGVPQLITRLDSQSNPGVEVRQRSLNLSSVSRTDASSIIPVSGWQSEFERVSGTLHIPPGWSLLHLTGADRVAGAWLSAWSLWDSFLVLVIAAAIARVTSIPVGALAFVTLVLTYQRVNAPLFIWLNLTAALALLPFAKGWLSTWLHRYLAVSFLILIVLILPFGLQQARQAVFPQLDGPRQLLHQSQFADQEEGPSREMSAERVELSRPLQASAESRAGTSKLARLDTQTDYLPAYDPSQKIQVGPGLPEWQWRRAQIHWSGPVQAGESARLFLASPLWNRIGAALSLLLTFLLAGCLALHFRRYLPEDFVRRSTSFLSSTSAVLLLIACIPMPEATAQVPIDNKLLQELERRLLQPPQCLPDCVAIETVTLTASGDDIDIVMQVHSAADLALPLPANVQQWWPSAVTVNGSPAAALQSRGGQMFVRLTEGRHQLVLKGPTPAQDSFSLFFALPLQNVQVQLSGWRVSGLPSTHQPSQTLQLQREQQSVRTAEQNRLLADPMPPYVVVTRRIQLGLEWTVTTEVERIAPAQGVINLAIPLLAGEAPTSGERNPDGTMDVRFGPQQQRVQWQSSLKVAPVIALAAGELSQWAEVWALQTSPVWHSTYSGLPPIATRGDQVMPIWQPWPGEAVTIQVQRPEPVPGEDIAIDQVEVEQQLGKRVTSSELKLTMRASFGGQFELPLPVDAELQMVSIDGIETPISHSQNQLQIPVRPGKQQVTVKWQQGGGTALRNRTPEIHLGVPSSNIQLRMHLPHDRWVLMVGGPGMGPAVLFWAMLVVVLLLITLLVRARLTPLKAHQWLLLSLGIATFHLFILALVAGWFIVLQLRGKCGQALNRSRFNLMQAGLFLFSIFTLAALLSSIPYSLLASPQMYITGNSSTATFLQWYQDRAGATLPQGWVISLPIYVYRVVMLVWSLWLAFSLMGWIRWGWQQLGVQGYWHSPAQASPEQSEPTPRQDARPEEEPTRE